MTKKTYYKLTDAQFGMRLFLLMSSHSQSASVPLAAYVEAPLDMDILKKAVDIEIERNDALRIRFKCGLIFWKQRFLPKGEKSGSVEVLDFTSETEDEMNRVLSEDAKKKIDFKNGELYRVKIFRMPKGDKTGIYINSFHLINDAYGTMNMFSDLMAVYNSLVKGLPLPPPLDSFEEKVKAELDLKKTPIYEKEKKIYEEQIREIKCERMTVSPSGISRLEAIRKKKRNDKIAAYSGIDPFHDESENMLFELSERLSKKISDHAAKTGHSPSAIMLMGYQTYCSAINNRTKFFEINYISSRRKTKKDKNMGGNLMKNIYLMSETEAHDSFLGAASQLSERIFGSFRVSDLTGADQGAIIQKVFPKTGSGSSMMMYSFMGVPGETAFGHKYSVTAFSSGRFAMPLYIFNIVNGQSGIYTCRYEYKTSFMKDSDILELHENAMRVIEAGIDNPDITVGELLNMIESRHLK